MKNDPDVIRQMAYERWLASGLAAEDWPFAEQIVTGRARISNAAVDSDHTRQSST